MSKDRVVGRVSAVTTGTVGSLGKQRAATIQFALDGIVDDRHRGFEREAWAGDKNPQGTLRRNERQWSAVSVEELALVSQEMDLEELLTPDELGANLCLEGIATFSELPRGTLLSFPSGTILMVEEYNPPCLDMGTVLAERHRTRSGEPLMKTAFSKAANQRRGVVGVVEVAGPVSIGDTVTVQLPQP